MVPGTVAEALPQTQFIVNVGSGETARKIHCYLAGHMYIHHIRILPGDKVSIVISPAGDRGRIVRRI